MMCIYRNRMLDNHSTEGLLLRYSITNNYNNQDYDNEDYDNRDQ